MERISSTGLSPRTASVLSYLGWWITGLIFWGIERRDPYVRFHAVQATVAFGGLALLIALLAFAGLLMLSFAPRGFTWLVGAAAILWIASMVLWVIALWQASRGKRWRIPLAGSVADARARTSPSASF